MRLNDSMPLMDIRLHNRETEFMIAHPAAYMIHPSGADVVDDQMLRHIPLVLIETQDVVFVALGKEPMASMVVAESVDGK